MSIKFQCLDFSQENFILSGICRNCLSFYYELAKKCQEEHEEVDQTVEADVITHNEDIHKVNYDAH